MQVTSCFTEKPKLCQKLVYVINCIDNVKILYHSLCISKKLFLFYMSKHNISPRKTYTTKIHNIIELKKAFDCNCMKKYLNRQGLKCRISWIYEILIFFYCQTYLTPPAGVTLCLGMLFRKALHKSIQTFKMSVLRDCLLNKIHM